jgi:hypothetical protein
VGGEGGGEGLDTKFRIDTKVSISISRDMFLALLSLFKYVK